MASTATLTTSGFSHFDAGDVITVTGADGLAQRFVVVSANANRLEIKGGWLLWLIVLRIRICRFAKSALARLGLRQKEN